VHVGSARSTARSPWWCDSSSGRISRFRKLGGTQIAPSRPAPEYADAITLTDRDVDDNLFEKVHGYFGEDAVVELTATIAWENLSSKFNRALRNPSQRLWERGK
jgi:hypothetical protein